LIQLLVYHIVYIVLGIGSCDEFCLFVEKFPKPPHLQSPPPAKG